MTTATAESGADSLPASSAVRLARLPVYSAVTAAVAAVVYLVVSPTLIDDAYITLGYARNFGLHLHWGLVPGLTDNTATSPLNVLILALLTAVLRNGLVALGVSFVLSAVGLEWGVRRVAALVGLPAWTGLLATLLCLLNPLVLSSVGMEVMPCAALTAWLLVAAAERRVWAFGLLAGLLAVLRADYVIIAVVVFLLRPQLWAGAWKTTCSAVAAAACWYVPSWFLLGSAIPDTLVIKSLQRTWEGHSFGSGPVLYWHIYPVATVLAFAPAVSGGLAWLVWAALRRSATGLRRQDLFAVLPAAAAAHYGAYTALGVPPYHWYYGPTVVLTTMFLAAAVAGAAVGHSQHWRAALRAGLMTAVLLLAAADIAAYAAPGLPRAYAPFTSNWAATATYRQIGRQLPRLIRNQPVGGPVEVGVIDYYCGCRVYEYFSDRGHFPAELARYQRHLTPAGRAVIRLNYTHLDRGRRPHPTQLVLRIVQRPDPHAIRTWRISTPWAGIPHQVQYMELIRRGS